MDLNLKDKVALVTGGSRGLGRVICLALAAEGAKVGVNYFRNAEKGIDLADEANAVVDEIRSVHGTEALALPGDMASEADILEMFRMMEEKFSRIDVLINNAAYLPKGPVTEYSKEEWDYTFQINVTGAFIACRELVKRLLAESRKGRIVNIVSQAAFRGSTTGHAPYDASKGAMVSFTIALAREVGKHGINVNALAPGLILTEMVAKTLNKNKERYLAGIPLNRIAEPEEIASIATFLASDGASYMTGTTVDASGGMMMR